MADYQETKILVTGGGNPYLELDRDITLADNSDLIVPTQKAVKAYADNAVTALFPATAACAYIDFNDTAEAEMTVTIGDFVYAEDDTADAEAGVFTNGANAAASAASLIAAINGDERAPVPFTAVADESGDGVWLFWDTPGAAGNVEISTDSEANCTVHESSYGGADAAQKRQVSFAHAVTAQELLSGTIDFPLPFVPSVYFIQVYTATGAQVAFTDLVTIEEEPDRLRITTDGATKIAATNVIHVMAIE
jgi:hypothetical protein